MIVFRATIDNDTVAAMPAARFGGRIVVVDREEQIEAACRDLSSCDVIGFDTETRPSFKAGVSHRVSLLQLSTDKTCYLFRLNRIRLDNRILKLLGSNRVRKVGVDVAGDIRSLHALRHFQEGGFIDLQHEAPRWGIEEKSLRKLSAIVLGERISKAQRLSNWEAGVLTSQQMEYAATDAWACIRILEELQRHKPISGEEGSPRIEAQKPEMAKPTTQPEEKSSLSSKRRVRRVWHRRAKHDKQE